MILVMDSSGSMGEAGKIIGSKQAARAALQELVVGRDRFGLISFNGGFEVLQPLALLTPEVKQVCEQAIDRLTPFDGTAIGPPTLAAVQAIATEKPDGSKMVLVMTDGEDSGLAGMTPTIAAQSDSAGTQVHSIAFGLPLHRSAEAMLRELARQCNGEFRHAPSNAELAAIFRSRVAEMVNECTLVYASPYPEADGLPRKVRITLGAGQAVTLSADAEYQIGPILSGGRRSVPVAQPGPAGSTASSAPASDIRLLLFFSLLIPLLGGLIGSALLAAN